MTRAFRGGHAAAHHAADAFISGVMRHVSHGVESGLKGSFALRSGDIGRLPQSSHPYGEAAVAHAPDLAHVTLNLSAEPEVADICDDEEDGWVSDKSSPEKAPTETGRQRTAKTASNRASKKRRIDRHRSCIHIHHSPRSPLTTSKGTSTSESSTAPVACPSTPAPDVPSSSVPEASTPPIDSVDEEPRGRALPASAPSTVAARSRPRHMRIVSLRGSEAGSREASPARSVRWADAPGSATARWPQSSSVQGSRAPSPGPPTPAEPAENNLG
jgi:hypothetical protein